MTRITENRSLHLMCWFKLTMKRFFLVQASLTITERDFMYLTELQASGDSNLNTVQGISSSVITTREYLILFKTHNYIHNVVSTKLQNKATSEFYENHYKTYNGFSIFFHIGFSLLNFSSVCFCLYSQNKKKYILISLIVFSFR